MAAKNKYDVILEKVGNQPLKTTKVLCSALGLGLAAAKGMVDKAPVTIATGIDEAKALDLVKQLNELGNTVSVPGLKIEEESAPAKKTTSNKSAAATDDAFDAIFGAGSAQKATPPVKSKGTTKTETKKATSKTSAKTETKATTKKKAAAASDDFDALFGGETAQKETKSQAKAPNAKIERIVFDNGDVYEGEMLNGLRHGKGKYTWVNGDEYDGEWAKGWRNGFGIYRSYSKNQVDGSTFASYVYEGDWRNSKKHGHGVATGYKAATSTGSVCFDWSYDGEWVEDNRHGNGKYTYADGSYFTGVWENNKKISASETILPTEKSAKSTVKREELKNGDVYEGEYKDGKYHGKGKYTSSKGWVYEGQFTNGQITGKGKITYATGAVYEGELIKGNKNGFGRITYTDGLYYEGEWKDDKKHGKSTYTQKLGSYTLLYTGMWNMSKRIGPHDYYSITNPEKKVYRQFYDNDEAVGSEFCPVGVCANWTMADAVANKKRVEAEHRQYWEDQKAREAAQNSSYNAPPVDTEDFVIDCSNKAMQAYNNRDYFRSAYYLHRGGLSGDDFYRDVIGMCYHPTGATGYEYVDIILCSNLLGDISTEDVNICAFVLDKFVPKGINHSKTYRAWCYYRLGNVKKAAGMISSRGLMFYNGRIQDLMEVLGERPFSEMTPYSDEIMARNFLDKVLHNLQNTTSLQRISASTIALRSENPANILRRNEKLQEKILLAEAYVKFAKTSKWHYQITEIEKDLITLKTLMK